MHPRHRVSWYQRAAIVIGVGTALAFLAGFVAGRADAFELRKGFCDAVSSLEYEFDDGGVNWTNNQKTWFNDYSDKWDQVDAANGNTMTSVAEGGDPDFPVKLAAGGGSTTCNLFGNILQIEMDSTALKNDFKGSTVHEIGHAVGFGHTAKDDSWDSDEATMSGCTIDGQLRDLRSREQDDGGMIVSTFSDKDIHANPSFEDAGTWVNDVWGLGGGASLTYRSSAGSPKGTEYGEIGPGGYIFQTMRVTDPGDMRGAFHFRKETSSASGTLSLLVQARKIAYDVLGSGDDCYDPDNLIFNANWDLLNPDFPNGTGFTLYKSIAVTPGTSWDDDETSAWTTVDGWEGVDVRIRVDNNLSFGGDDVDADLDHLRVRHLP